MVYIDEDSDSNTFNSSYSTLDINASYNIIWAGLYWEGKLCDSTSSTACIYPSNSDYDTFNKSKDHRDDILFKTPNRNDYITVTANRVFTAERTSTNWSYSAFADVTSLIDPDERGAFGVANIALSSRYSNGGGNYGGWAMLVIYEDPSNQLHYKNISVFNGFEFVDDVNNPTEIFIDGFLTPISGDVTGSIALFAADGDPVVGGDMEMREGTTSNYSYVGDTKNPTNNLLNSTITEFGQEINTGVTKTYGVDADRLDVSTFLTNDQSDTNFKFGAGVAGQLDYYSLSLFAFATDLTTPVINDFSKDAVIVDLNGTRTASPGQPIYPGSELIYTLTFTNSGDEVATSVEIFDDFDFDGLTFGLDLNNFDITKTNLYSGTDTTSNPIANACGYDVSLHRVYCRIDSVAIDATYTMQFSVTVADPIDTSMLDQNATNTAYAQYKNPNGDTYVILESNEWGDFGGKSNSLNAGIFTARSTGSPAQESVDAINANYTYAVDRNITTKIVNSDFQLKLIYLDTLGQNVQFSNSLGYTMPVLLSLCTSGDRLFEDGVAAPEFTIGDSEIITDLNDLPLNITKAHQNDKIKMSFVNWGNIDWDGAGVNCVQRSSTSGNYKGVPQCLNSENKILQVFPQDSWPYIYDVCLGNSLGLTGNQVAACTSNAYSGWVPNSSKQIVPERYDNTYGCLQCLTDASAEFSSCSTDNFAARPDRFELDSTNVSYPDLLRSGLDYNLSMQALDGPNDPTHPTTNYNQIKNNLDINQTLYLSDDTVDTANLLHGTVTFGSSDYNITNGLSVAAGTASNEVVGVTFDDVAKVNIRIEDQIWTFVDRDDTPLDCTSTVNSYGLSIEGSAYICGDVNTTFIPEHFNVTDIHLNNHAQTTFTYLSNDLNMSAHVDVTISAMNANDVVTQNFTQGNGFYENPVSVDLNVTEWKPASSLHPWGNNVIIKDIPTAQLLGFGSPDANGTHMIPWNESNATQKIMFNYERLINQTVNPFDVNGTELNITVVSTYTGTAPEGTAVIDGDGVGDRNATFQYARTRSSKFFYDDITDPSAITPIFIDVYCDLGPASCFGLNVDTINGQTNEFNWWLSWNHSRSRNDGNITLEIGGVIEGAGSPTVSAPPKPNIDSSGGADQTVTVTANATTLPMTVEIDLVTDNTLTNYTNSWLIYNSAVVFATPADTIPPDPFYKVRFIGTSGWAGHGKTGHVVDSNASIKKNRRLGW